MVEALKEMDEKAAAEDMAYEAAMHDVLVSSRDGESRNCACRACDVVQDVEARYLERVIARTGCEEIRDTMESTEMFQRRGIWSDIWSPVSMVEVRKDFEQDFKPEYVIINMDRLMSGEKIETDNCSWRRLPRGV